ncbi:MAG TPA: hypothetical protein VK504_13820 [Vicinamibacterales bacterium]|nr:hypothetical protein [Vicinamibacterales bacterium]
MHGQLIGTGEAARILGVNRATIVRWVEAEPPTQLRYVDKLPGPLGGYLFDRGYIEGRADAMREKAGAA